MCRVFVLYVHSLFAQGVVSLLRQQEGLEVVGAENDAQQALDKIRALRPDVVIVDGNDAGKSLPVSLPDILHDGQRMRVINLHFGDNSMDIYDGQQVLANELEDLIAAIRSARVESGQ